MTHLSNARREAARGNGVAQAGQFGHQTHTAPGAFDANGADAHNAAKDCVVAAVADLEGDISQVYFGRDSDGDSIVEGYLEEGDYVEAYDHPALQAASAGIDLDQLRHDREADQYVLDVDGVPRAYPLSTEPLDGEVTVSDDGEDQECVCGNAAVGDGYWLDADPDGKIDPDRQQSTDDADHAVCPKCGRVYKNGALFEALGSSVPAVARYDVDSPEFQAARQAYEDEIF